MYFVTVPILITGICPVAHMPKIGHIKVAGALEGSQIGHWYKSDSNLHTSSSEAAMLPTAPPPLPDYVYILLQTLHSFDHDRHLPYT